MYKYHMYNKIEGANDNEVIQSLYDTVLCISAFGISLKFVFPHIIRQHIIAIYQRCPCRLHVRANKSQISNKTMMAQTFVKKCSV